MPRTLTLLAFPLLLAMGSVWADGAPTNLPTSPSPVATNSVSVPVATFRRGMSPPSDPGLDRVRQKVDQEGVPTARRAIAQTAVDYAQAQQNPTVVAVFKGLDGQFNPATGAGPMAQVINPKDNLTAQVYTLWLANKVYGNQADGRYSYLYASLLSRTRLGGNQLDIHGAAVQYFRASLALAIDAARCSDPSGADPVIHGYEDSPMGNALKAQITAMDAASITDARFDAISLETALGERAPTGWLCMQSQTAKRKQPVAFVSDDVWHARRQQILDGSLQRTLAAASGVMVRPVPLPAASAVAVSGAPARP